MTLVQLEQLEQLKKVTWDGDIIGATARDYLVAHGFAERYNGWNFITRKGIQELLDLRILSPGLDSFGYCYKWNVREE